MNVRIGSTFGGLEGVVGGVVESVDRPLRPYLVGCGPSFPSDPQEVAVVEGERCCPLLLVVVGVGVGPFGAVPCDGAT